MAYLGTQLILCHVVYFSSPDSGQIVAVNVDIGTAVMIHCKVENLCWVV